MAIVRCNDHPIMRGAKHRYVAFGGPPGHPSSGLICGRHACTNPGVAWLTEEEVAEFERGQRVFGVHTNAVNIGIEPVTPSKKGGI